METTNNPRLLPIKKAAELIDGLTVYGLETLCKQGKVPFVPFGSKKMIDENVLIETLSKLARETHEAPKRKTRKDKGIQRDEKCDRTPADKSDNTL